MSQRPPAMQMKSADIKHTQAPPRWVRMRRMMFAASVMLGAGFVFAVFSNMNGLSLFLLICVWGLMSVAVPMPHLPTLLRLMTRSMPGLSLKVETFLRTWEFDQIAEGSGQ